MFHEVPTVDCREDPKVSIEKIVIKCFHCGALKFKNIQIRIHFKWKDASSPLFNFPRESKKSYLLSGIKHFLKNIKTYNSCHPIDVILMRNE